MTTVQPPGVAALRDLLARHGVRPTKALGQHFVIDPNTIRRIVALADLRTDDNVLEIGAGAGSLTVALAGATRSVTAVELDRSLIPALEETLQGISNVRVVRADAMRCDPASFGATHLVGNLPYSIATPLVLKVLEGAPEISRLTVMIQREVGDRLVAAPGSSAYGQASVLVAYFATARTAMRVSRHAFWPEPGVESVVVRMQRRSEPDGVDRARLFEVVKTAFSQRRKMIRGALADLAGSPMAAEDAIGRAGVDPTARAETLSLEDFVAVASELSG